MNEKTIKIKNVSGNTLNIFNPIQQTFNPGEVVEVSYSLGKDLAGRLEFEEVVDTESKPKESEESKETKKSKKVK
jgi:hypothetical protein